MDYTKEMDYTKLKIKQIKKQNKKIKQTISALSCK